jgi:hypothetical protein
MKKDFYGMAGLFCTFSETVTASAFQRSSLLLARRSLRQKAPRDDKWFLAEVTTIVVNASQKPSLRALFSEAVSCLRGDRFGKKRLAMTSGFLRN